MCSRRVRPAGRARQVRRGRAHLQRPRHPQPFRHAAGRARDHRGAHAPGRIAPAHGARHPHSGHERDVAQRKDGQIAAGVRPGAAAEADAAPAQVRPPALQGVGNRGGARGRHPPVAHGRTVTRRRERRGDPREPERERRHDPHLGRALGTRGVARAQGAYEVLVDRGGAVVLVLERRHVAAVLHDDERAAREPRGDHPRIGQRRDVVEVAVQDQRGHVRVRRRRRHRRVGERRRRPAQAGERALVVEAGPFLRGERRERPARIGGQARADERRAQRDGCPGRPQLGVVMADHRQVQRLGELPRVAVRPIGGDGLGHEPQERRGVARERRPGGREDVAPHALVVEARLQELRHRVRVGGHVDAGPVGVWRDPGDRVAADPAQQLPDQRQRMAARRAAGTALAGQNERALRAPGDVGKGRVGPGQLVGAVEHERPQPVRVADREGLGRV